MTLCFETNLSNIKDPTTLRPEKATVKSRKATVQGDLSLPFVLFILVIHTCLNPFLVK